MTDADNVTQAARAALLKINLSSGYGQFRTYFEVGFPHLTMMHDAAHRAGFKTNVPPRVTP